VSSREPWIPFCRKGIHPQTACCDGQRFNHGSPLSSYSAGTREGPGKVPPPWEDARSGHTRTRVDSICAHLAVGYDRPARCP